jgi:hypothetical protein
MKGLITSYRLIILLIVVTTAVTFLQPGKSLTESSEARAQDVTPRLASFTASQVFGLAQGEKARFCVGTLTSRGPALDWHVRISDERGNLLLQLPDTHSPEGEWRCVDVPRSSINIAGDPTGRVQVAAREIVKAPAGTTSSAIVGSFEIVKPDGSSGAVAAVLYAAFHNND